MKPILQGVLLLAFLTSGSGAAAQDPIVVDFEQFPVVDPPACPSAPHADGATFVGGLVREGFYTGINVTHVYRSTQPVFSGWGCFYNPMEIRFDEPTSLVSFDLITYHDSFTIQDDTGWSRTISVWDEATEWNGQYYQATITVPSTGVRGISLKDHCDYYGSSGCTDQWRFAIDNVTFRPDRACLAINGPSDVEPNPAGATIKNIPVVVEVTDCEGNPLSDIAVETTISVDDQTSGGHLADHPTPIPRPLGGLREDSTSASGPGTDSITLNSDDGQILLQFVPPEVSGIHTINAKCVDVECYEPDPPLSVSVKIDGLAPIPRFDLYYTLTEYLPGMGAGNIGDNGKHDGVNHWLTPEASEILWRVAFHYAALLDFQPDPERLHVNDASLPMGGLFDIHGQWRPDHRGHRKGTVVDIRANTLPGAVPPDYDQEFKEAARTLQAKAEREFANRTPRHPNEHYHLMLRGVDQ